MVDENALMVVAVPGNARYAADDPRQQMIGAELAGELRRVVPLVTPPADPASKGVAETTEQITVMLGSLSAVRYAVLAFRAWLERDAKRKVELKLGSGTSRPSIHLRMDGFDEETVIRTLRDALDGRTPD